MSLGSHFVQRCLEIMAISFSRGNKNTHICERKGATTKTGGTEGALVARKTCTFLVQFLAKGVLVLVYEFNKNPTSSSLST